MVRLVSLRAEGSGVLRLPGEQQVPPLRRRWCSGSGRNDKVMKASGTGPYKRNKRPARWEREGWHPFRGFRSGVTLADVSEELSEM